MLLCITGCDRFHKAPSHTFTVMVQLSDSLNRHRQVSLTVVNDTYSRLQQYGSKQLEHGMAQFSGQTSGSNVAFLLLDSLSDKPFYFVLEPGTTHININLHKWSIAGGHGNARYTQLLNEHRRLLKERENNRLAYLKAIADTTLTLRTERNAVVRDSLLTDSLQHFMEQCINGTDAASRIMCERFFANEPKPLRSQREQSRHAEGRAETPQP